MSNKIVSKEALLRKRLREDEIEIEGLGWVKIRGLSRKELLDFQKWEGIEQEQRIVSAAMVEPSLSIEDVADWQAASQAGEINDVAMAINRLSGIGKEAGKDAYKSVRDES